MKKRWNKVLAILLVGSMLSSMLVGCGAENGKLETDTQKNESSTSAETTEQESSSVDETAEPVTIRVSWWGSDARHEAMLSAIELYESKHPHVTIEGEYQGYDGYYEKMMTTLSGGTAPDLMMFKKEWLADVQGSKHYLANLKELSLDTSTLAEGLMEKSGMYNGEQLMYSAVVTGQVIYVNSDFVNEYGIEMDKTYTWQEFMDLGSSIHDQNPDCYLMAADVDVLNRLITPGYIAQATGESLVDENTYELNFTKEQMSDAFQLILDLYDSNTLEPFGESAVFVGQMDQNTKWINGQIGCLLDVTSGFSKYEASISSEIDVLPIPRNEDAKSSGVDFAGNTGFVINDNSENKDAVADFLYFLMNDPEATMIIKSNFGYNSTSTAVETLVEAGELNETLKKAVEIAQPDSISINSISSNNQLESTRKDLLQEVIYRDITPDEAAEALIEQYKELLAELKTE